MTDNRSPHEPATSYTARIAHRPALRKLTALAAQYSQPSGPAHDGQPRADEHVRRYTDLPTRSRGPHSG